VSGEDHSRICVGGLAVGIVGLKAAIAALRPLRGRGDDEVAQALLSRLAGSNPGVFATPGLVINDEVRAAGKLPTRATLRHWIRAAAGLLPD
jgi:hypothetical protein